MVKVDFASHSPQMDPLRADLLQALEGLVPRPASMPIYSTVTGMVGGGLEFEARYWARNLREPVLFSAAVQRLLEDGHDIFLEISPHPVLLSAIQQGLNHFGQEGAVLPSMRREEEERTVMLGSLGALYTLGYPLDWNRLYPAAGQCVRLPGHSWQRERCWMETATGDSGSQWERVPRGRVPRGTNDKHPLLGRHFKSAHPAGTHFWEVTLDKRVLPYLDDHRIEGVAVLPASAYVEMALAAAVEAFGAQSFALKNIEFHRALFLPDGEARPLQLILSPGTDGAASFQYTVALRESANPVNHGRCTRQEKCLLDRTTVSLRRGRGRSRRSRLDARKRSLEQTFTRDSAKAVSTTVLSYRALLSCGGTTEMCWVKCEFPKSLKLTLAPIKFIRRAWMPACKLPQPLLRLRQQKTVNRPSSCRPT